jgi:hypothetical protein
MALSTKIIKDIEFVGAVELAAYARIASITCRQQVAAVSLCWHHNNRDGGIIESRGFAFVPDHDGEPIFRQAYAYMKSLPEFAGATDC